MIAVATDIGGMSDLAALLDSHGASTVDVVSPTSTRRVVLVETVDEHEAQRLVVSLRSHGALAVIRPDGGIQLDAWRRETEPIVFADRLSVCPAWSEHDRRGLPGLIELGPGGFGNGRHPTTGLLIEALVRRVEGGERVLDVGCGSGVLGLCALGLGARNVVAVDLKQAAVEATRRNGELNAMSDRLDATDAPVASIDRRFDVVVANIARAGIVELAPDLLASLAPGGWLGVSGISPPQCAQVVGFLSPLVEVERHQSGEWASLVLTKSAASPS